MRTKLDRLLEENQISTLRLVQESKKQDPAGRGYSRNHLYSVRRGETEPTRECIAVLLASVRRLTGKRQLRADDLFDFAVPRRKAS